ncbi:MAG: hypothetical protein AAGD05_10395, partial [Bacteroidota bacterium]
FNWANGLIFVVLLMGRTGAMAQTEEILLDLEKEYQLALERMAAHQYEQALYHIYNCQRMEPDRLDYNAKLGFCYFKLGNYSDAKRCFRYILKRDTANINALSNLALIYDREANYEKAHQFYVQLLQQDSTNSYYYKQTAYVAIKREAVLEAIQYFGRSHELNPKDITVVREMANLYLALDAPDYAQLMVDKGYQLDSMNIKMLYTKAKVENKQKRYPQVVQTLERVLVQGDTASYFQTMLGVAYLQMDSLDDAQFHFEHLLAADKASEHIHHYLSLIYDKRNDPERSIEQLERAIEKAVSEKLPLYYRDLATIYETQQSYRKAVQYYQAAYDWSGKQKYLFYLARAQDFYYKDKRIAMRTYQKYLATDAQQHRTYAEERLVQLKRLLHFQTAKN